LNVTSFPLAPTAVHWLAEGHATALSERLSSGVGAVALGAVGLNVTALPAASAAVHWLLEGHATPFSI
jgi:hypothetical protein